MRKSLRTLQVLAVTAIAAAGLGVVASPAYAATCTTGNLCMWNGQYETGTKRTMTLSPGNCVNLSSPWDNRIRSFWNKSSSRYYAFTNYNCSATPATMILDPGWEYLTLGSTFDEEISSIQRAG